MAVWQEILLAFGGGAGLLAVLGWLGVKLLDSIMARDSKRFEADLKAKADVANESLKHTFQITTMEHQVRFTGLQQKRASVIAELSGLLAEVLWAAEDFLSPMEWAGEPSKQEKHTEAMKALVAYFRFFDKHRIYFSPELCASLSDIAMLVRQHVIAFGVWLRQPSDGLPENARQQKDATWNAGWAALKDDVPKARGQLEDEFRKLLGSHVQIEAHSESKP